MKAARRQVARDAFILVAQEKLSEAIRAGADGEDPVILFKPVMEALWVEAVENKNVNAIRELLDRVDGKVQQEIKVDRDSTVHVDAGLLGNIGDLLKLVHGKREEKVVLEMPPAVEKK